MSYTNTGTSGIYYEYATSTGTIDSNEDALDLLGGTGQGTTGTGSTGALSYGTSPVGLTGDDFAVRFSTYFTPTAGNGGLWNLTHGADDGIIIYIDGVVHDARTLFGQQGTSGIQYDGSYSGSSSFTFNEGQSYLIEVVYWERGGGENTFLNMQPPSGSAAALGTGSASTTTQAVPGANVPPVIATVGTVNVAEGETDVVDVDATDANGGTLTYTLDAAGDAASFDIDSATGELTFKTAPDFENPTDLNVDGTYIVNVTATDLNGASDTETVTVNVTNVAPAVTSITAATNNPSGTVSKAGDIITYTVTFDEVVTTNASPLQLGGLRIASYSAGSGTNQLTFTRTVQRNDTGADLEVTSYSRNIIDAGGLAATGVSTSSSPLNLSVDNDAPLAPSVALTLDSGTDGSDKLTNNAALTITGIEAGATIEFSADDIAFSTSQPTPTQGSNTVYVRQVDTAGNAGPSTEFEFSFDNIAPVNGAPTVALADDSNIDGDSITKNAALSIGNLEAGATAEYSTDNSTWSTTQPAATQGSNTVYVRQVDVAGNPSPSASITFTFDDQITQAPSLSVNFTNGNGDTTFNASEAIFVAVAGIDSDASGSVVVSSDGGGSVSIPVTSATLSPIELSAAQKAMLTDGTLSVALSVSDTAGNTASVMNNGFDLDTTPPASENETVSLAEITDQEATSTGTAVVLATLSGADDTGYALSGTGGVYDVVELFDTGTDWQLRIIDSATARGFFDFEANPMISVDVIGTDDAGNPTTSTIDINLSDLNDAPEAGAGPDTFANTLFERADGATGENASPFSTTGSYTVHDDDAANTHNVQVSNVSAERTIDGATAAAPFLGILTAGFSDPINGDGDGVVNWTFNIGFPVADPAAQMAIVDALAAGETIVQTYNVTVIETDTDPALSYIQPVTVTIEGTNDAPVFSTATAGAMVVEPADGTTDTIETTGTLTVADVDTSDDVTVSVTGVAVGAGTYMGTNPLSPSAMQALLTLDGGSGFGTDTGALSADGAGSSFTWKFAASHGLFDFLPDGDTLVLDYTLTANDANGGTPTKTVSITVTGSNDQPVITDGSIAVGVVEAGGVDNATMGADSVSGDLSAGSNWTDADDGETATLVVRDGSHGMDAQAELSFDAMTGEAEIAGTYGSLFVQANGTYRYALNDDAAATQALNETQTTTETFNYTIANGPDADDTAAQTLTVNIAGSNDAPVISFATGANLGEVTEAGVDASNADVAGTDTVSGTLTADDVDAEDDASSLNWGVSAEAGQGTNMAGAITSDYGTFAVDANGVWTFTLDNSLAAVKALHDTETATEDFTVTVTDAQGVSTEQTVTITINGTNDRPTLTADAGADTDVIEQGLAADGSTILNPTTADTMASGSFTYADDDTGGSETVPIWSIIDGTGSASAMAASTKVGTYGSLSLTDAGAWTYTLDDTDADTQALTPGAPVTDVFTVRVADSLGGFSELNVTVNVTGTNDAPNITVDTTDMVAPDTDAGSVQESDATGLSTSGTLTVSDVDASDSVAITVENVAVSGTTAGSYASPLADMLSISQGTPLATGTGNATGSFTWSFDSGSEAFDFLANGESIILAYTVQADDGDTTDTQTVTVTVSGTNDQPVISVGAGSAAETIAESDPAVLGMGTDLVSSGTLSLSDDDASNTHTISAALASGGVSWTDIATSSSAGTLPDGLETALAASGAFTAALNMSDATQIDWNFALADTLVDFLGAGETLTVTYDVTADDGGAFDGSGADEASVSAVQQVTITITGTDDAPTVTADNLNSFVEGDSLDINALSVSEGANAADTVTVNLLGTSGDVTTPGALSIDVTTVTELDTNDVRTITGTTTIAQGAGLTGFAWSEVEDAFDLGATGAESVTFNRNAAVFDMLDDGEFIEVFLSYTVTTTSPDGTTNDNSISTAIRITGDNDAPYIVDESGFAAGLTEFADGFDDGMGLVENGNQAQLQGTITFNDVDPGDIAGLSVVTAQTQGTTPVNGPEAALVANYVGTFQAGFVNPTGSSDGTVFYTFDLSDGVLDNLAAGEQFTQSYEVSISDGTDTTVRPIVLTFTGTNDAPVIGVSTPDTTYGLTEDAGVVETGSTETQTLEGTLSFDDVDTSTMAALNSTGTADTHTVTAVVKGVAIGGLVDPLYSGATGSLTFDATAANGANAVTNVADWTYTITDGGFDFLAAGDTAAVTFTVTVDDGQGGTATTEMTFTVTGTNDAPVLAAPAAATLTDTAITDSFADVTGTLTRTDADDGSSATYSAAGQAASTETGFDQQVTNSFGVLYLNTTSGAYRFVADAAAVNALTASQDITFDLSVSDGTASDMKTLTLTLAGANDAPVLGAVVNGTVTDTAAPDTYADVSGSFTSTDVDTGATATYSVTGQGADVSVSGFTHSITNALGTLFLNEATGAYNFVANDGAVEALSANTTVVFDVTVSDGTATDTGTFTIDFTGVNDAPLGTPSATLGTGTEDTGYTVSEADLIAGFTDAEGDMLSVDALTADNGATVVANGAGGFTVTPVADFNGVITLSYSVVDGNGGAITGQSQTFELLATPDPDTITGNGTLDASVTDSQTGNWVLGTGIPVTGWAVASDDVDAPNLEIALNAPLRIAGGTFIDPNDTTGQTYVVPDGTADGTPQSDGVTGTADDDYARWNFQISIATNANGGTGGAIGDYDFTFVMEDTSGATPVQLGAFTSAQFAAALEGQQAGAGVAFLAAPDLNVSWNLAMDFLGFTSFDPNAAGEYRISVTADDPTSGTEVLANQINIIVNEAPVAVTDTIAATEDTAITILAADILTNDTDGNSDTLSIQSVTSVTGGTAVLNGNGDVVFTPAADFNGAASFTYVATDGQVVNNLSESAIVTVNVAAVNDAPVNTVPAVDYTTDEDTVVNLSGLSVADVDITGDVTVTLSVTSGTLSAAGTGVTVSNDGTSSIQLTGTLSAVNAMLASTPPSFTPAQDFNGNVTLTMLSSDGGSSGAGGTLTDSDTVTISVAPVNDAPVALVGAVPDNLLENTQLSFAIVSGIPGPGEVPLSSFATDVDGNIDPSSLSFNSISFDGASTTLALAGISYANGVFSIDTNTALYQSLDAADTVSLVIGFTVTDSEGAADTGGQVTVTVEGINDVPTLADINIGTLSDTAGDDAGLSGLSGTLIGADNDGDDTAAALTYGFSGETAQSDMSGTYTETSGMYGTLRVYTDGSYDYTPLLIAINALPEGMPVADDFTVTVTDTQNTSSTATITVTIDPANDTPELAAVADIAITDTAAADDFVAQGGILSATDRDAGQVPTMTYSIDGLTPASGETAQTFYWDRDANMGAGGVSTTAPVNGEELGTLTVTTAGGYSFEPNDAGINGLRDAGMVDENPVITTTLRAQDVQGGFATTSLTINIDGANDNPIVNVTTLDPPADVNGVVQASAKELAEGDSGTFVTEEGSISFTDIDSTSLPSFNFQALGSGYVGSISFTPSGGTVASGTVGWEFEVADSILDTLAEGEALNTSPQLYNIIISDGQGGSVTQQVAIAITGSNDAPVIGGTLVNGSVSEAVATATVETLTTAGALTVTDVDLIDTVEVSVTGATVTGGTFGGSVPSGVDLQAMLTLVAGSGVTSGGTTTVTVGADTGSSDVSWIFTSGASGDAAFDFLATGETLAVSYTVTADDKGGLSNSTDTQTVVVTITGTNDGPIAFADIVTAVGEDTADVTFATASATDPDLSDNVDLSYSIAAGNDAMLFEIDSATGEISLASGQTLDAETAQQHVLTVEVEDTDGLTDTQQVTINVNDVDEFATTTPADTDAAVNAVDENATSGATGLTVSATDADVTGAPVSYAIVGGTGQNDFDIDAATGVVTVSASADIDREATASLTLDVQASDANGTLGPIETFTIAINDVDEFDAEVAQPSDSNTAANQVAENAATGAFVGITAAGDDEDATDTISYSLVTGGDNFDIDAGTGVVTVASTATLDFETDQTLALEVLMTSTDGTTTTANYTVAVTDVDDEAPTFTLAATSFDADENATADIVTLTAADLDTATSGISFTISGGADQSLFTIDGVTNALSFLNPQDFEAPSDVGADGTYEVTVRASDPAGNFTDQAITVSLNDVNEAPTAVTLANAVTTIDENTDTTGGVKVADINISDDAIGTNAVSLGGNDAALFTTFDNNGQLELHFVGASPDFETTADFDSDGIYDVTVSVDDAGVGNTPDASASFSLMVTDVNEAPVGDNDTDVEYVENEDRVLVYDLTDPAVLGALVSDPDNNVDASSFVFGAITYDGNTVSAADAGFTYDGTAQSITIDTNAALYQPLNVMQGAILSLAFTVQDAGGLSTTGRLDVGLVGLNDAPVVDLANSDVVQTTDEDVAISGTITATDEDNATLAYSVETADAPSNGVVVINSTNGDYTYTPALNANGADSFTVSIFDGLTTTTQVVNITVDAVDDAPVANDTTATTDEDVVTTVDVASSIVEVDGEAVTVTASVDPAQGTVGVAGTVITFTPTLNFNGPASITYTVTDTAGALADSGTIDMTVNAVDDAPEAADLVAATDEDTPTTIDVASLITEVDGDTVTVTAFVAPSEGSVTVFGTVITFAPALNFNGPASISYTVTDNTTGAQSDTGTVSVAVAAVNDASELAAGLQVTPTFTEAVDGAAPVAVSVADAVLVSDVDGLDYDSGVLSAAVTSGNATDVLGLDTTGTVAVSGNDVSVNGTVVGTVTGLGTAALSVTFGTAAFAADVRAVVQALNYASTSESPVMSRDITLDLTDGDGLSAMQQTVSVSITAVNDAPVANDVAFGASEGAFASTVNVTTIGTPDSDPEGDIFSVTALADIDDDPLDMIAIGGSDAVDGSAGVITTDWGAEVTLQSNGQLFYNLTSGSARFNELAQGETAVDSFSYTITDANGGVDTATVAVTITGTNDNIVAVADTITATETTAAMVTGDLLANDTDVDVNDTRSIVAVNGSVSATAIATAGGYQITTTDGVVIQLAANGSYSLTAPDALDAGQLYVATFQYTVQDGGSTQSTTTVTVNVTGDNDAPNAAAVTLTASDEDATRIITEAELLTGASDPDAGAVLTITDLSLSDGGGALIDNMDGTWTYTPDLDDNGAVTFDYTVSDGALTATSTAGLDLLPVNDAPVIDDLATDTSVTGDEDTAITGSVVAADVDLDTLSFAVQTGGEPANGAVIFDTAGGYTYTPTADFNGTDSFTVEVTDGNGGTDTVVVSVTVDPVNDAAIIAGVTSGAVDENTGVAATGVLTAMDVDNTDDIFIAASGTTAFGSYSIDVAGLWSYTADDNNATVNALNAGDILPDSFVVASEDGTTQTISITINGAPDGPTPLADLLFGSSENDRIDALEGNDTVDGDAGNDRLWGGLGNDSLLGNSGIDTISGDGGDDFVDGGADNDRLFGNAGMDTLTGDFGHDYLDGGLEDDNLSGGVGNDTLLGSDGNDTLDGGGGFDILYGQGGDDFIFGGANSFSDTLYGGNGNDTLDGGGGPNLLVGDAGNDSLTGNNNLDTLEGGFGQDTLIAGDSADIVDGGSGNDSLIGNGGEDTLTGGLGDDWMDGGANRDVFVFGTDSGDDTIANFQNWRDQMDISALGLTGFADLTAAGAISASGSSTLIDLNLVGGNGSILLEDFDIARVDFTDFIF